MRNIYLKLNVIYRVHTKPGIPGIPGKPGKLREFDPMLEVFMFKKSWKIAYSIILISTQKPWVRVAEMENISVLFIHHNN